MLCYFSFLKDIILTNHLLNNYNGKTIIIYTQLFICENVIIWSKNPTINNSTSDNIKSFKKIIKNIAYLHCFGLLYICPLETISYAVISLCLTFFKNNCNKISDNKITDNKFSDNKITDNKITDNKINDDENNDLDEEKYDSIFEDVN